jgi:hypothetical protein
MLVLRPVFPFSALASQKSKKKHAVVQQAAGSCGFYSQPNASLPDAGQHTHCRD